MCLYHFIFNVSVQFVMTCIIFYWQVFVFNRFNKECPAGERETDRFCKRSVSCSMSLKEESCVSLTCTSTYTAVWVHTGFKSGIYDCCCADPLIILCRDVHCSKTLIHTQSMILLTTWPTLTVKKLETLWEDVRVLICASQRQDSVTEMLLY